MRDDDDDANGRAKAKASRSAYAAGFDAAKQVTLCAKKAPKEQYLRSVPMTR